MPEKILFRLSDYVTLARVYCFSWLIKLKNRVFVEASVG